jgi:Endomembrane protein 70
MRGDEVERTCLNGTEDVSSLLAVLEARGVHHGESQVAVGLRQFATDALVRRLQIHWFSIINSCVTVLLLTGFLATILMRVLKNDFIKYSREEEGALSYLRLLGTSFPPDDSPTSICVVHSLPAQLRWSSADLSATLSVYLSAALRRSGSPALSVCLSVCLSVALRRSCPPALSACLSVSLSRSGPPASAVGGADAPLANDAAPVGLACTQRSKRRRGGSTSTATCSASRRTRTCSALSWALALRCAQCPIKTLNLEQHLQVPCNAPATRLRKS